MNSLNHHHNLATQWTHLNPLLLALRLPQNHISPWHLAMHRPSGGHPGCSSTAGGTRSGATPPDGQDLAVASP